MVGREGGPISPRNFIGFNNISNILRYLYEKPPHNNDAGVVWQVDLLFVLDGSGSMTQSGFDLEKTFVKAVVDFFDVAPDETRVAAINYATKVRCVPRCFPFLPHFRLYGVLSLHRRILPFIY